MNTSYTSKPGPYMRLAEQRRAEQAAAEAERAARVEFIAKMGVGAPVIKAATFNELGDLLVKEGYKMHKAKGNGTGSVVVPHKDKDRKPAVITRREKPE